ncbi:N-acetylmuramoyl-L-alanine amidase [Anaerolentibacter hominis]|uniref:N-acetylmuramoyl-L-alanine amidase n=1 Tax=Anaerolentibacter hominis TaxID=3079009 RepID=UPI0031B84C35
MKIRKVLLLVIPLLLFAVGITTSAVVATRGEIQDDRKIVIALDAGHGGDDPGKIGINGALEKDINLSICYYLKEFLELNDIEVVLTRTDEKGLYEASDQNKKTADLNRRLKILEDEDVTFAVSIHQNSFEQESSKGAQVFYYTGSEDGRQMAEMIQQQIITGIQPDNHRVIKPNDTYYLLKNSCCPLVIVECGFLSNQSEAELLCEEDYQEKMAWAIHMGIMQYINSEMK